MNFKKIIEDQHISFALSKLQPDSEPLGSVVAWSGYVLVTRENSVTDEKVSLKDSLTPFPSVG